MPERTNEEVLRTYLGALVEDDAEAIGRHRDPGWAAEYPQSGERIPSHADERAIADHYPGGMPEIDPGRIVGTEDTWVVTPSLTFERIAGSGDAWWSEGKARYPDGSLWHTVTLYQMRQGRIYREITYWAQPFDPPAWRAAWVEPIGS